MVLITAQFIKYFGQIIKLTLPVYILIAKFQIYCDGVQRQYNENSATVQMLLDLTGFLDHMLEDYLLSVARICHWLQPDNI